MDDGNVKRKKILKGKDTRQRTVYKTLFPRGDEHPFSETKRKFKRTQAPVTTTIFLKT